MVGEERLVRPMIWALGSGSLHQALCSNTLGDSPDSQNEGHTLRLAVKTLCLLCSSSTPLTPALGHPAVSQTPCPSMAQARRARLQLCKYDISLGSKGQLPGAHVRAAGGVGLAGGQARLSASLFFLNSPR